MFDDSDSYYADGIGFKKNVLARDSDRSSTPSPGPSGNLNIAHTDFSRSSCPAPYHEYVVLWANH